MFIGDIMPTNFQDELGWVNGFIMVMRNGY
jgi:hypothetical protein